jgi:thiosulfate dehydrogenase [quinone] large subunit
MGREPAPEGLDLLDRRLAYALFRLALGGSLLLHGATRLAPGGGAFPLFGLEEPALPLAAAPFFDTGMVLLTTGLGLLLVLGLWTRAALLAGAALVTALVIGNACRTDDQTLMVQMMYLAMFYLLPPASHYNVFSADTLLRRLSDRGYLRRLTR